MATIHLAGSIALFLFGGLLIFIGIALYALYANFAELSILVLIFCIGIFLISAGVFVANMSKSKLLRSVYS